MIVKTCACGKVGGVYLDEVNAEFWGPCIPMGIDNRSLASALRATEHGLFPNFTAFLIDGNNCHTFKERRKQDEKQGN